MLNYRKSVLLSLVFLLVSIPVQAATWRVEKDGSGDFSVIQHAVDASADGDSILIGPGRYVDFEWYDSGYWIEEIIVVIENRNNLTLIGSDTEETIVGPTSYYSPYGESPKLFMGTESNNIRLENLNFENCEYGIAWNTGSLSIGSCKVSNCYKGIISFSPGGVFVENSEFFQQGGWSIVTAGACRDMTIVDSSFHGIGTGIGFNQTENANVSSCFFEGLYTAIGYSQGSIGQVTDCTMTNVENPIEVSTGSQLFLLDSILESTTFSSLFLSGGSHVSGTGNVFSGGGTEFGTLNFSGGSTADLSGNHIFKGESFAVSLINYYYDQHVINLANNYWDTTDIETIEEWIHDGNDDPTIHGVVEFLPLADGPVPTESTSWDSLKAMFRDVNK